MGTPNVVMPIAEASAREIDIVPTWRYANCYPQALQVLVDEGRKTTGSRLSKLITHRFDGIDKVPEALRTAGLTADSEGRMVVKVAVNNHV
jgi:L-iditol 2-dehydrogenase